MKVHYFKQKVNLKGYPGLKDYPGRAACSFFLLKGEDKFITKNKSKVTCENCKRTKLFKGVK